MAASKNLMRMALVALLFAALSMAGEAWSQALIEPEQAWQQARAGKLTIIDVRTPQEWRQSGVPKGAARATILPGDDNSSFMERVRRITGGDKAAPIAMICRSGVRSQRAAMMLRAEGYSNVQDIKGGFIGDGRTTGWVTRKLPKQPCPDC